MSAAEVPANTLMRKFVRDVTEVLMLQNVYSGMQPVEARGFCFLIYVLVRKCRATMKGQNALVNSMGCLLRRPGIQELSGVEGRLVGWG